MLSMCFPLSATISPGELPDSTTTKASIPSLIFKEGGPLAYLADLANGDNKFTHITTLRLNNVYTRD